MKPVLKYILIAIIILLLVVAVWQASKAANKPGSLFGNGPAAGNGSKKAAASTPAASKFPLKMGSTGAEVKNLQNYLNFAGSYGLVVDGNFGQATQNAVQTELTQPGGVPITTVDLNYYNSYVVPYINGTTITNENQSVGSAATIVSDYNYPALEPFYWIKDLF